MRSIRKNKIIYIIIAISIFLTNPASIYATVADRYDVGFFPYNGKYVNRKLEPIPGAVARGVDVSSYQGKIRWDEVAEDDISFAFIRCGTSSSGKDSMFDYNAEQADANGIAVGIYYRTVAMNAEMAEIEALFTVKCAKEHNITLPLVIDVEGSTLAKLGQKKLQEIISTFCDTVEKYGYESMVYASTSFMNNHIGDIPYRKWIAQYGDYCTYKGSRMECWQCSSHGCVRGIDGRVDLDFILETE